MEKKGKIKSTDRIVCTRSSVAPSPSMGTNKHVTRPLLSYYISLAVKDVQRGFPPKGGNRPSCLPLWSKGKVAQTRLHVCDEWGFGNADFRLKAEIDLILLMKKGWFCWRKICFGHPHPPTELFFHHSDNGSFPSVPLPLLGEGATLPRYYGDVIYGNK